MPLLSGRLYSQIKASDVALKYVGITESGENKGKEIEKWQAFVGAPKGASYCAAFVSWVLNEAKVVYPKIRTAVARKFITKKSIKAIDVYKGRKKIGRDYIAVWRRGDTWRGHVGITLTWRKRSGFVVEGNTRLNGLEGVFIKYRAIKPYSYFRITHFTRIINGRSNETNVYRDIYSRDNRANDRNNSGR